MTQKELLVKVIVILIWEIFSECFIEYKVLLTFIQLQFYVRVPLIMYVYIE